MSSKEWSTDSCSEGGPPPKVAEGVCRGVQGEERDRERDIGRDKERDRGNGRKKKGTWRRQ